MGRAYSINGFLNAALRRTAKTILVEGPTDKTLLHRIDAELFLSKIGESLIDHVGIIDDPQLSGMGNREKVYFLQNSADNLATSNPKISAVLGTLTDREWDCLDFVESLPTTTWQPPTQGPNRFVTLGHSVENYYFEVDCVKEYLKFSFAEYLSLKFLDTVDSRFTALLILATVLSVKIHDDACISKCGGLVETSHLSYRDGRYYLDTSFSAVCASRNFVTAATIVTDVNNSIDLSWNGLSSQSIVKWLPHGHIGDDVLWAGIAHIALELGVASNIVKGIARGHKKERDRFRSQWLCTASSEQRLPLDDAVAWLHS